ncbi:HEAT repeat domain-containing protein [Acetonema longum]|uniref:HEAT repeat domain-containing protein n=1 Tax=Acetonema longum DSM 6540 TaxID=1009370 RepID=F7NE58_9FIRM|nr:HEAT repeat domain-containing protein [Acetonema longum]EGO65713.1 hypothetical protein ALO_01604 [Acetonema longum DSM 6540]
MSIALLYDTQTEVRRLFIAGGDLAAGDFRLKKILPGLRKAGEAAPVFLRVADAMEKVIEPEAGKASENLLELATLVNAVLYTQGETGLPGEIKPVETIGVQYSSRATFRAVMPVIEALTGKGSGRYEILKQARADQLFNDLRLLNPLIAALGDSYAEIAGLAYEVLAELGPDVAPVLRKSLDFSGDKAAARILDLLSGFQGAAGKQLYLDALEQGSLPVKVSALKALKDLPECEEILFRYAVDSKKELREAAYTALAAYQDEQAAEILFAAFKGKDRDLVQAAVQQSQSRHLTGLLLAEAEQALAAVLTVKPASEAVKPAAGLLAAGLQKVFGDPAGSEAATYAAMAAATEKIDPKVPHMLFDILECLAEKQEPDVFAFLTKCLAETPCLSVYKSSSARRKGRVEDYGAERTLARAAAHSLFFFGRGTEEGLQFLVSQDGKHNDHLLGFSLAAALLSQSPEYVYKNYARYAAGTRKNPLCQETLAVFENLSAVLQHYKTEPAQGKLFRLVLHEGWIKKFVAHDELRLVCSFIQEGCAAGVDYLVKYSREKINSYEYGLIVHALKRVNYKELPGLLQARLESLLAAGGKVGFYYELKEFAALTAVMEPDFAGVLEEAAGRCDARAAEVLLTAAYDLKNKGKGV